MSFDISIIIEYLPLLLILASIGVLAGYLAGLLGIGGGIVLVPGLYYSLTSLGYDPAHMMHLAVGTSLAIIVPTGFSSARSHWKKGAVGMDLVKRIGIGIVIGVVLGTIIADKLDAASMKMIFAVALIILATIMVINPSRFDLLKNVPGQPWSGLAGIFIGGLSTLMGIGGATISVPYMSICGVKMHKAVGTASALGMVISVPAAIGFMVIGNGQEGMPPLSVGYVNFLAWLLIIPFSVMAAPLGAKAAHALPVNSLRLAFAVFMVFVSLRMLWSVLGNG